MLSLVVAALVGLLVVGPAMSVVIDRVPDRLPLRGRYPDREPAPPVDLLVVPFQPWILRRGRGPGGVRLPWHWLASEALSATMLVLAWDAYGGSWVVVPVLVVFIAIVPATIIDVRLLRIPDRVVFPALAVAVPAVVVVSLIEDQAGAVRGALIGALAFFVALLLPHLAYPKGMGFGDVKFALLLGLVIGWLADLHSTGWLLDPVRLVIYALIVGLLVGVLCGLFLPMIKRGRVFPLGPGLAAGAVYVILNVPDFIL
jgi:leader peptidase (prepilin peptidase) / N-methyltransferase